MINGNGKDKYDDNADDNDNGGRHRTLTQLTPWGRGGAEGEADGES